MGNKVQELKEGDIPAFPLMAVIPPRLGRDPEYIIQQGSTLRDQFAIAALSVMSESFRRVLHADLSMREAALDKLSSECFLVADSMLKQRAK